MTMRDHESRTSEITEVEDFDEYTLRRARLTVCEHSTDLAQANEMMLMLGIHPSQFDDPRYGTASTRTVPAPLNSKIYPRPMISTDSLIAGSFDKPMAPSASHHSVHHQTDRSMINHEKGI